MNTTKVIAVVNQKGGVGKTTTAYNLAAELSALGKSVCLIDFDPQANLSRYLGFAGGASFPTIATTLDKLAADEESEPTLSSYHNNVINVDYIPSEINLATVELRMAGMQMFRELALQRLVESLKAQKTIDNEEYFSFNEGGEPLYDYIIIDSLPSMGILFSNVLMAADRLLVPCQTQDFSADGLRSLFKTLRLAMRRNRGLKLIGILPTMASTSAVSKAVLEQLRAEYGDMVLPMVINHGTDAQKACSGKIPLSWVGTKLAKKILGSWNSKKPSKLGEQYRALAEYVANDND